MPGICSPTPPTLRTPHYRVYRYSGWSSLTAVSSGVTRVPQDTTGRGYGPGGPGREGGIQCPGLTNTYMGLHPLVLG